MFSGKVRYGNGAGLLHPPQQFFNRHYVIYVAEIILTCFRSTPPRGKVLNLIPVECRIIYFVPNNTAALNYIATKFIPFPEQL